MAKKAKRRGRPPGSKNKVKAFGATKGSLKAVGMTVDQLRTHIGELQDILTRKVTEQRDSLTRQLAELEGFVVGTVSKARKTFAAVTDGRKGKRAKAAPKYQSKKDKSLKWSGRGMTPVWMREEMKGTKLTKDAFLIAK